MRPGGHFFALHLKRVAPVSDQAQLARRVHSQNVTVQPAGKLELSNGLSRARIHLAAQAAAI